MQADGSVRQGPAAYACRDISASALKVGARVRWVGSGRPQQIEVRALAPDPRAALLGELSARWCPLPAQGDSGRVLFDARASWIAAAPVGVQQQAWRWQYRLAPTDAWSDFALTRHEVFTTLHSPGAPWSTGPLLDANIALPWSELMAYSCRWAAGAYAEEDAATRITARLFSLGPARFEYGCPIFGHEMYANTPLNLFDATALLERLEGGEGNGRYVNCTDCACIVSTMANMLGARLWQSRMGQYQPAFMTRDILTIGGQRWQSPCGFGLGFMFHEVAWSGQAQEWDAVYDACVLVNADYWLPGLLVPLLPANLGFGPAFGGLYRDMFAQAQDQFICQPRPEERRCRMLM